MSHLGPGTRTLNENVSKRYLTLEKENIPLKRETDEFILTKDSGKQFTNSAPNRAAGIHRTERCIWCFRDWIKIWNTTTDVSTYANTTHWFTWLILKGHIQMFHWRRKLWWPAILKVLLWSLALAHIVIDFSCIINMFNIKLICIFKINNFIPKHIFTSPKMGQHQCQQKIKLLMQVIFFIWETIAHNTYSI